jgi:MoxR-vWA-beta-propeller ternary system domain bpX1
VSASERANAYLTIPPGYGESLGGLRWSVGADALEDRDGRTFALVEELSDLLDGIFSRPPVPPFAFVLNLFYLMKRGGLGAEVPECGRLRRAFSDAQGAVALPRHAGLLIGELCRNLPGGTLALAWTDVRTALSSRRLYGARQSSYPAGEPPLPRAEFERRLAARLRRYDDTALLHWLKHGDGPTTAARPLAEAVESLPALVARLLVEARRRPRLVGAAALTPALEAALTLPPRRLTSDAPPQGGYADLSVRGEPEQLLPGQFALDPDDFVRRFAERELLYFRREEPHTTRKPERLIVLDQGVRTWGRVRLALAAAALSLLKKDPRRFGLPRLVLTSTAERIDPQMLDVEPLTKLLEASDLTPHPAEAVSRALEVGASTAEPRDVILLTHPRNIREPDVAAAARLRRAPDRFFALSVDEHGRADLVGWTERGMVPVRLFRVDLAAAEAARAEGEPPRPRAAGAWTPWTGDVEPIRFPFRPGLVAEAASFNFDAAGDWLVIAGRDGVLHGVPLDGGPPEVLPRAYHHGAVLKQIDAILPARDGVVVCGWMNLAAQEVPPHPGATALSAMKVAPHIPVLSTSATLIAPARADGEADFNGDWFVAAHYDRLNRRARLHVVGPFSGGSPRWLAYPDLHCIVLRPSNNHWFRGCALDLETLDRFPGWQGAGLVSRAQSAWNQSQAGGSPYTLPIQTRWSMSDMKNGPHLFLAGNTVHVKYADPPWVAFEPQQDGLPLLGGAAIQRAVLAGNVLALSLSRPGSRSLVLFRGPDGAIIREIPLSSPDTPYQLSRDGRLLARRRRRWEVEVSEMAASAPPLVVAALARLHDRLGIRLAAEPFQLVIRVGDYEHTFWLHQGCLMYTRARSRLLDRLPVKQPTHTLPTSYDRVRFPPQEVVESGRWRAALDRLGQVLLFTDVGDLVAAFLVRRHKAAAWTPNGVFWGEAALIGGPATPDAPQKIGGAIQSAAGGG